MKRYVLGFLINESLSDVVLIRKNRPLWQKGKLNGVGGKIEENELPVDAMVREFFEETGVKINHWKNFLDLKSNDSSYNPLENFEDISFEINVFYSIAEDSVLTQVKSATDELVGIYNIEKIKHHHHIPNIQWQIKMALSFELGEKSSKLIVKEI